MKSLPTAEELVDQIYMAVQARGSSDEAVGKVLADRNALLEAAAKHLHNTDYEAAEAELRAWIKDTVT